MNIEEQIEKQQQKKQLLNDIETAKTELGKTVDKITEANTKFQQLRKDREKFIKEVEVEAKEKIRWVEEKMRKATQEMISLEAEAVKTIEDTGNALSLATEGVRGLELDAERLVGVANGLKVRFEGMIEIMQKNEEKLNINILKNSEHEKDLKKRKEEVDQKNKEADEKLQQAEKLAYWHKEPGATYK